MWIRRVPEHHFDIVERFGRYHRTLGPGLHWLYPWAEVIRARVDLREHALAVTVPTITADDVVMSVDMVLRYAIVDPVRATYEVSLLRLGLKMLAATALRSATLDVAAAAALDARDEINGRVSRFVEEAEEISDWGVRVRRIEIMSIEPDPAATAALADRVADVADAPTDGVRSVRRRLGDWWSTLRFIFGDSSRPGPPSSIP